jgi:hypothetical protein
VGWDGCVLACLRRHASSGLFSGRHVWVGGRHSICACQHKAKWCQQHYRGMMDVAAVNGSASCVGLVTATGEDEARRVDSNIRDSASDVLFVLSLCGCCSQRGARLFGLWHNSTLLPALKSWPLLLPASGSCGAFALPASGSFCIYC